MCTIHVLQFALLLRPANPLAHTAACTGTNGISLSNQPSIVLCSIGERQLASSVCSMAWCRCVSDSSALWPPLWGVLPLGQGTIVYYHCTKCDPGSQLTSTGAPAGASDSGCTICCAVPARRHGRGGSARAQS
jgi:hypothetical protein